MTLTPTTLRDDSEGYELAGRFHFERLLAWILPRDVASPVSVSWNQLEGWLRAVGCLRRAAWAA